MAGLATTPATRPHTDAAGLLLDPAGSEFDSEVAAQLEGASKAQEAEALAQAAKEAHPMEGVAAPPEGGGARSGRSLWRAFELSQPGARLDHLDALASGEKLAVVTCSPVPAGDASPR